MGAQGGTFPGRPGVVCGDWDRSKPDVNCAAGEVCVLCEEPDATRSVRCAPNPTERPDEYETFSASCTNGIVLIECDGPEDCADETLCQFRPDSSYATCSAEAPTCDAHCVTCNSREDCEGADACVPNSFGLGQWRGATCGPALYELLLAGDWLIGWTGANDHYSWFHFTKDVGNSLRGTVKTQICTLCSTTLGCEDGEGTYEVVSDTSVAFEFSEACAFSYHLVEFRSPPYPYDAVPGEAGLASMRVIVDDDWNDSATATLYAAGVACDSDFGTCMFPPP
jgi:hypothetical protein